MLLVGLPEARAAKILVESTSLGAILCSKLQMLIKNLPMNVDPADVESTEAKWGLDSYSAKDDKSGFAGKRNLKSFLSYLDFIDTLLEESHKLVAMALANAIRIHGEYPYTLNTYTSSFTVCSTFILVFDKDFKSFLLATNENTALSITSIVTKMVSECKSQFLIKEASIFLLGQETQDPEQKGEKARVRRLNRYYIDYKL